jgi:hypothetical protein
MLLVWCVHFSVAAVCVHGSHATVCLWVVLGTLCVCVCASCEFMPLLDR